MRIIAGAFRGRRLTAPKGLQTRPTTDRVREAWFSILGPLEGTVLDLYAGTGALGFEALSRGADRAVFVESSRRAASAIEQNAQTLGVSERILLLIMPVESCLPHLKRHAPFSLIVTDPPWTAWDAATKTLRRVLNGNLLTTSGRLVLGHPKGRAITLPAEAHLHPTGERTWGDSAATFFEARTERGTSP
jgi:16S rRNA (guanine(966)-N(2))-methyltransferase RsmD